MVNAELWGLWKEALVAYLKVYEAHSKSSRNRTLVFKWCIVHYEFVPRGRSITAAYYIEVLTHLRENVRQRRPQKWKDGWILHHDNVLSHMVMAV
jgi:hypothetical protein